MVNIQSIINDFTTNTNFTADNEVSLFEKFVQSIQKYDTSVTFIDKTHGASKAQVQFVSQIFKKTQCEISDLLIVVKNKNPYIQYRATFWQAKKVSKSWNQRIKKVGSFNFNAQFNQWELLSTRPEIKGVNKFLPDKDLLKNATSPSIGSFGVFYPHNNTVEVNYSVAEMITINSTPKNATASSKASINEKLEKYFAWSGERIVCNGLHSFLNSLYSFTIGSLLDKSNPSDQWLLKYIQKKCIVHDKAINYIENDDLNEIDFNNDDGISLLLFEINEDVRNEN